MVLHCLSEWTFTLRNTTCLLTLFFMLGFPAQAQQLAPNTKAEQTFYCAAFYRERVAAIPAIAVETRDAIEDSAADLRTKLEIEHKIKLDARDQMALLRKLMKQSDVFRVRVGGAEQERAAAQRFQADAAACQAAIEPFAQYQSSRQCIASIQTRPGATIVDCAKESTVLEASPILDHCGRMAACVAFATGINEK